MLKTVREKRKLKESRQRQTKECSQNLNIKYMYAKIKIKIMDYTNYKDDMNKAFHGDPNDFMNSLKDEEYKNYIHKKYELIMQFFQKMDTNNDGVVSYNELVTFLDQNMNVND